jgi:hypothetical protein
VLGDTDLGLSDRNASYLWSWFALTPGDEILVEGRFPHARYASFVVQDQDGAVIDSLDDVRIVPERGRNPFQPGAPRSGEDLGEYRIRVSAEALPASGRAPNTLYAGRSLKGEPNRLILLNYRNYLTDRRYAAGKANPLWITGGVKAPALRVVRDGVVQPCPEAGVARAAWRARQPSTAEQTRGVSAVPGATEARNPPAWTHTERKTARATNKLGPNDSTVYTSVPLSARFGDFILFRWTPPTLLSRPTRAGPSPPAPTFATGRSASCTSTRPPPTSAASARSARWRTTRSPAGPTARRCWSWAWAVGRGRTSSARAVGRRLLPGGLGHGARDHDRTRLRRRRRQASARSRALPSTSASSRAACT